MFEFKEPEPIKKEEEQGDLNEKAGKEGSDQEKIVEKAEAGAERYLEFKKPPCFSIISKHLDWFDDESRSMLELFQEHTKISITKQKAISLLRSIQQFWQKNEEAKIKRKEVGEKAKRQQAEALLRKQKKQHKKAYSKYERLQTSVVGQFIKELADNLRREGVPVEDDGRIQMSLFTNLYSEEEISRDWKRVSYAKQFFRFNNEANIRGEKLEMFKTALFNKFLGDKFVVVRSSLYDDFLNGVDNLVIEKSSGNPVCMFDETTMGRANIGKKYRKVEAINYGGGASLKYGLGWENEQPVVCRMDNIPIFVLALNVDQLAVAFEQFAPSLEEKTADEERIFRRMLMSLKPQLQLIKNIKEQLPPKLVERLNIFEDTYTRILEKMAK